MEFDVILSATKHSKYSLRKRAFYIPNTVSRNTNSKKLEGNKFHPYKLKFIHTLTPESHDRFFDFCWDIQAKLEDNPFMARNTLPYEETTLIKWDRVCP